MVVYWGRGKWGGVMVVGISIFDMRGEEEEEERKGDDEK